MVATFIVLATFNGQRYIAEQIESIQAQSIAAWRLLVRDDGSTDRTLEIVDAYRSKDDRIEILPSGAPAGIVANFSRLFEAAYMEGATYVLPCDQDDVWRPDKIDRMLGEMTRMERVWGKATPLLVHSDLEVVDATLKPLSSSFMQYQGLAHDPKALRTLMLSNFVTGCASMLNRPLIELSVPIPDEAIVHDWWAALCAASSGRIGFLADPLVKYRQHGANAVGAKPLARPRRLTPAEIVAGYVLIRRTVRQAGALLQRLKQRQGPHSRDDAALAAFSGILGTPRFLRAFVLAWHRIGPPRPGAPLWRKFARRLRYAWVISRHV